MICEYVNNPSDDTLGPDAIDVLEMELASLPPCEQDDIERELLHSWFEREAGLRFLLDELAAEKRGDKQADAARHDTAEMQDDTLVPF